MASSVAANAAASPGATCQPVSPSATTSVSPPMAETSAGRPKLIASMAVRPSDSGSFEGATTMSAQR